MSEPGFYLASCDHCGQHVEFPAEGDGLTVPCPHCNQDTVLTQMVPTNPEAMPEEINAAELKAALAGTVKRRRVSIFYQLGLLLVALFMILLPVVYVAFVASVGFATYWYSLHGRALFSGMTGGIQFVLIKLALYLGPIMGGSIAVFFMLKPLLARPRRKVEPRN